MLVTKLHRPNVGPDLIYRNRLLDQLDQNIHQPLTLISAPSGYGKSILVSQWIEKSEIRAAWISLDDEIKDLRIFLGYLTAALRNIIDADLRRLDEFLQGQKLPPYETVFTSVVEILNEVEENFVLIFDDYQVINNEDIHGLLNLFISYPVENMHLVIICRRDPPLKFNQLRLYNRINEIRLADLVFDIDDTRELVSKHIDHKLTKQELAKIKDRAEGWVLGIQMILKTDEIRKVNKMLKPTAHYSMAEYSDFFADLVLKRLSERFSYTMYASSLLDRFNSELIDAIFAGTEGSLHVPGDIFIKELKAANLFIYSLDNDGIWYRFHHFFGDMLRLQLTRQSTNKQISEFHKNASNWFEQNEYLDEAYNHALKSGDVDLALRIVEKYRRYLIDSDQYARFMNWISRLPEGIVEKQMGILITRAMLMEAELDYVSMRQDLIIAKQLLNEGKDQSAPYELLLGEYHATCAGLEMSLRHYDLAYNHSVKALELLTDESIFFKIYALAYQVWSMCATGRFDEASATMNDLLENTSPSEIPLKAYANIIFSMCHGFQANLHEMVNLSLNTRALGLENKMWVAFCMGTCFSVEGFYNWNELEKVAEYAEMLEGHYYAGRPLFVFNTLYKKAFANNALGKLDELTKTTREIKEFADTIDLNEYHELTKVFEIELAIQQNDIKKASELAKTADFDCNFQEYFIWFPWLTYIKLLVLENDSNKINETDRLIEEYIHHGTDGHKTQILIQVLLLQAIHLRNQGQNEAALKSLKESLDLAEPRGFIRIYLDLGEPMKELLEDYQQTHPDSAYTSKILADFGKERTIETANEVSGQDQPWVVIQNLSGREVETLQYISKGFRNKEIADILNISVETVKSHVKNSLRKVGAKNRVELIRKAGMFELI